MSAALAHRGPDDTGTYQDPILRRCQMAHRRLSIIDLAGGHQPLSNENQSIWICYNGECYNFQELRRQLESLGHRFRTRSDTEVIVHLYEQYGGHCVDHLRGMFAFAIWDQNHQQLFLARDRMGKKPLYYAFHQGSFLFASEPKAILQVENFPRVPDTSSIALYLLLQYVPAPRTGFAHIRQLPPAHTLTLNAANFSDPRIQRYWSIPAEPTFAGSFEQACEMLRAELTEAVRLRLISDVPLGAFLSGGIDSTVIVALMSRLNNHPVKAASIGFEEDRYNELPFARQIANLYHCDHAEYQVKPDCINTMEKLSYFYDEPFADCSALPTYHLSQTARSRVTVALTGDGGDECFGGYDRYRALQLTQRLNQCRLLSWLSRRRLWQHLPAYEHHSHLHRLKRLVTAAALPAHQRYLKWLCVFDPDMLAEILSSNVASHMLPADRHWSYLAENFPKTDAFGCESHRLAGQAMLADGLLYLPGDLNTKIDRAGMSIGLELRCPFQDHKVVELAYSLPVAWRHNGKIGKVILRKSCADLIPENIARRAKMGFGVPVGSWFRRELRGLFLDTVLSDKALQRGYFQRRALENLLRENDQKLTDHGHRLWALLMLELWHQRYIDGKPMLILDYAARKLV